MREVMEHILTVLADKRKSMTPMELLTECQERYGEEDVFVFNTALVDMARTGLIIKATESHLQKMITVYRISEVRKEF